MVIPKAKQKWMSADRCSKVFAYHYSSLFLSIFFFLAGSLSNKEYSEKDWPDDVDGLLPYPKSKTLAEKAAWDFVENLKGQSHSSSTSR